MHETFQWSKLEFEKKYIGKEAVCVMEPPEPVKEL